MPKRQYHPLAPCFKQSHKLAKLLEGENDRAEKGKEIDINALRTLFTDKKHADLLAAAVTLDFSSDSMISSNSPEHWDEGVPLPMVHNIVSTSQIYTSDMIDLKAIANAFPFSYYNRKRFAAITIRLQDPDCTTLLFSSGKLVVTGSRNFYECVLASNCICKLLRELFPSKLFYLENCKNQNIVGHVELKLKSNEVLDIQSFYYKMEGMCMYQPNLFPGLVYRPDDSPVVLLMFYSGKIVITGAKSIEDVYGGWEMLWPTVRVFIRAR